MSDSWWTRSRILFARFSGLLFIVFLAMPSTALEHDSMAAVLALQKQAATSLADGNEEDADQALERALRLDSKNSDSWELLSEVRLAQGREEQAAEMAAKAASLRDEGLPQVTSRITPSVDLSTYPEVLALPETTMVESGAEPVVQESGRSEVNSTRERHMTHFPQESRRTSDSSRYEAPRTESYVTTSHRHYPYTERRRIIYYTDSYVRDRRARKWKRKRVKRRSYYDGPRYAPRYYERSVRAYQDRSYYPGSRDYYYYSNDSDSDSDEDYDRYYEYDDSDSDSDEYQSRRYRGR